MRAGELRHRIAVYRASRTPDGMGGWIETETLLLECYAAVAVPSARDGVVAMRDAELRTHEILMRRPPPAQMPKIGDVAMWRGARLRVRATRETPGGEGLYLDCMSEV